MIIDNTSHHIHTHTHTYTHTYNTSYIHIHNTYNTSYIHTYKHTHIHKLKENYYSYNTARSSQSPFQYDSVKEQSVINILTIV